MIRPTKHVHPDKTLLSAATILLRHLKRRRIESYDKLLELLRNRIRGGNVLFLPALNLLFLLGLIAYHQKNDTIEYKGANEAL